MPVHLQGRGVSHRPDRRGHMGLRAHAAQALDAIAGDRINQVGDWEAARRLLSLRWNHRHKTDW